MATGDAPQPEAGIAAHEAQGAGPFVINLCSSTTPMALAHPDAPEMKRFSFFVSRRREDDRERFRLHMGYFGTLAEAEEWLTVVRDIYPGAWAGEAPGKKLRARAAAAATQAPQAATTAATPRDAGVASTDTGVASTPMARPLKPTTPMAARPVPPDLVVPTLHAAPAAVNTATTLMQPVLTSMPPPAAPSAPVRRAGAAAAPARPSPASALPIPPQSPAPAAAASAPARVAAKATPKKPAVPPALSGSNVREVMAALDETGETRQMRAPQFRSSPATAAPSVTQHASPAMGAAAGVPVARSSGSGSAAPALPATARPAEARRAQPATKAPAAEPVAADALSDTQVLRFLEQRREDGADRGEESANSGISLLKPDDTQTRLALKDAVRENAPVAFAVQLHWSVQPVQLDKVPPLAIFSAYTLYTVEGSREGRKWYGLRLGFFSDAISAKQVAYYVRSEFTSVAIVPVSPQEKSRATAEESQAAAGALAKRRMPQRQVEEFKLFDADMPAPPAPAPVAAAPKPAARPVPPRKNRPLGKVRARDQKSTKTLEETLEILGASDLEIDNGRGEVLNDTGVRHLRVEVQKNTPFARLLDRLSERVRRS